MKKTLISISVALLAACANPQAKMKGAAELVLADYESAIWRNIHDVKLKGNVSKDGGVKDSIIGKNGTCGLVNGKNALGGYVGFTPFMYSGDLDQFFTFKENDDDFAHTWNMSCVSAKSYLPVSKEFAQSQLWGMMFYKRSFLSRDEILELKNKEKYCGILNLRYFYAKIAENEIEIESEEKSARKHCQK